MAVGDFPQYQISILLDNGVSFQSWITAATGLPRRLEDALAVVAANAIKNFDWSAVPMNPPATSATVTLTRQDIANIEIPLS